MQAEINHKQQEVNILWHYKLNEPFLKNEIATLEKQVAELEKINIKYQADELYIDYINSEYLKAITYITVTEMVTDCLYTGDRELRIKQ